MAFQTEQNFPQTLISVAEWFREKRRQGSHGLPHQIVIQYSRKKKMKEKIDTSF